MGYCHCLGSIQEGQFSVAVLFYKAMMKVYNVLYAFGTILSAYYRDTLRDFLVISIARLLLVQLPD